MVLSYVNVNPEPAAVPDRTPGERIPQCRSRCPGQSCARQLNYSGRHHGRQERALRRHHPSGRVPRYDESTRQQGGPRRPCRATDERSHQVDVTEKARADDHDDNGAEARWLMLNMSSPSFRVVRPLRRRRRAGGGSSGYGLWLFYPSARPVVNAPCAPFYIGKHQHFWRSAARETGIGLSSSVQWLQSRPYPGSDRTKEKGGGTTGRVGLCEESARSCDKGEGPRTRDCYCVPLCSWESFFCSTRWPPACGSSTPASLSSPGPSDTTR